MKKVRSDSLAMKMYECKNTRSPGWKKVKSDFYPWRCKNVRTPDRDAIIRVNQAGTSNKAESAGAKILWEVTA